MLGDCRGFEYLHDKANNVMYKYEHHCVAFKDELGRLVIYCLGYK